VHSSDCIRLFTSIVIIFHLNQSNVALYVIRKSTGAKLNFKHKPSFIAHTKLPKTCTHNCWGFEPSTSSSLDSETRYAISHRMTCIYTLTRISLYSSVVVWGFEPSIYPIDLYKTDSTYNYCVFSFSKWIRLLPQAILSINILSIT